MSKGVKRLLIVGGVILLIGIVLYSFFGGTYNKMITKEEAAKQQWQQVENVYQRRADLIPNLVSTVKGYAEHEKSTFTAVTEARSKATSITVDVDNLDAAALKKFQQAQNNLTGALSKLLAVSERYPNLKASQNFSQLQAQLEGTENRITVERMKFNKSVQTYNTYIKKFPQNLLTGMYGFESMGYFEMEEGAQEVPQVEF